jgi:hypothetical protein
LQRRLQTQMNSCVGVWDMRDKNGDLIYTPIQKRCP